MGKLLMLDQNKLYPQIEEALFYQKKNFLNFFILILISYSIFSVTNPWQIFKVAKKEHMVFSVLDGRKIFKKILGYQHMDEFFCSKKILDFDQLITGLEPI